MQREPPPRRNPGSAGFFLAQSLGYGGRLCHHPGMWGWAPSCLQGIPFGTTPALALRDIFMTPHVIPTYPTQPWSG